MIKAAGIVLKPGVTDLWYDAAQAATECVEEMLMTFQAPYRPSGRSVWLGKDLVRTDDWIVRLSPATLEEIDAAVSHGYQSGGFQPPRSGRCAPCSA